MHVYKIDIYVYIYIDLIWFFLIWLIYWFFFQCIDWSIDSLTDCLYQRLIEWVSEIFLNMDNVGIHGDLSRHSVWAPIFIAIRTWEAHLTIHHTLLMCQVSRSYLRDTLVITGEAPPDYFLVCDLEHFLFSHILGIIIPTDFHIFQRSGSTTNQYTMCAVCSLQTGTSKIMDLFMVISSQKICWGAGFFCQGT